jgi:hypothetical protein
MYTCQERTNNDAPEWLILDAEGKVVDVLTDFTKVEGTLKRLNTEGLIPSS